MFIPLRTVPTRRRLRFTVLVSLRRHLVLVWSLKLTVTRDTTQIRGLTFPGILCVRVRVLMGVVTRLWIKVWLVLLRLLSRFTSCLPLSLLTPLLVPVVRTTVCSTSLVTVPRLGAGVILGLLLWVSVLPNSLLKAVLPRGRVLCRVRLSSSLFSTLFSDLVVVLFRMLFSLLFSFLVEFVDLACVAGDRCASRLRTLFSLLSVFADRGLLQC